MSQTTLPPARPLRLGVKHGQCLQIGDVTVRVSLNAARYQGRRATLVIENPSRVPVKVMPGNT